MKYYLSDYDWAYAWNEKENQMYLCTTKGLKPVSGKPDVMWCGLTEEEAKQYAVKN